MENKTLVISGATRGIGKAIAEKFASEGVNIAFTYNSNEELAKELADDKSPQFINGVLDALSKDKKDDSSKSKD